MYIMSDTPRDPIHASHSPRNTPTKHDDMSEQETGNIRVNRMSAMLEFSIVQSSDVLTMYNNNGKHPPK